MTTVLNKYLDNSRHIEMPIDVMILLNRNALCQLQSFLGTVEITFSQNANDLEMVQKSGSFEFVLRFPNSDGICDEKWDQFEYFFRNVMVSMTDSVPMGLVSYIAAFRSERLAIAGLIAIDGLALDRCFIPALFLRVFCSITYKMNECLGKEAMDRSLKTYLHVLCSESFNFLSEFPKASIMTLKEHRSIMVSNKRLRKYIHDILDLIINSSSRSHQLLGVILMSTTSALNNLKPKQRAPKCHCLAVMMSSTVMYTLCEMAPGWQARLERADKLTVLATTYFMESNFNRCTHPHFCAHCGIFESENIKLKTCRLCKEKKLPARYLMCSMECQVKSWSYHKILHRMPQIHVPRK